jgi:predicted AAA+ superfamily ATPase
MTSMDNLLVKIASSQREEFLAAQNPSEVSRDVEALITKGLNSTQIKVVMGPRRSGKSTVVRRSLSGLDFAYFNFEDDRLPESIDTDQLLAALSTVWGDQSIFFFDEIQNLHRWEKFLHRLHRGKKNLIVTGSNSKLLSKELATSLTGRFLSFTLLPFSWNETKLATKQEKINTSFLNYLQNGGFPDVVLDRAPVSQYLSQLWHAVVARDIAQRYKVRAAPALRALGELILKSIGSRVSGRSLQKALPNKISNTTLENFLHYGEEAFLFVMLNKFEPSLAKQKKADRKPYAYDTGFIKAVRPSLVSAMQGQLLENYVFLKLIRRGAEPNIDLFYFQGQNSEEVDFVVLKVGEPVKIIQVCWSMQDPATSQREIRGIVSAAKGFGADSALILTFDEAFDIVEEGIKIKVRKASDDL